MAIVDVIMPQMGESIAEGTITKWYKKVGDKIAKDETLLEISTDKVDSEIPSPSAGLVAELLFPEQKTVDVHTVIARIQTDVHAPLTSSPEHIQSKTQNPTLEIGSTIDSSLEPVTIRQSTSAATNRFFSPLVMNIARAEGISLSELEKIPGSGANNRVSKKDVLDYIERRKSGSATAHVKPSTRGNSVWKRRSNKDGHDAESHCRTHGAERAHLGSRRLGGRGRCFEDCRIPGKTQSRF